MVAHRYTRNDMLAEIAKQLEETAHRLRQMTEAKHGDDYCSVVWFGQPHAFSPAQAAIVRLLWVAWESRTPDVLQETLLLTSGLESRHLLDLFRDHAAWGTMIIKSPHVKGAYRLAEPQ